MISKYFKLHELLPRHLYAKFGEDGWKFIDERLIATIDVLKEHFPSGTITINNYYWGGSRQWSGLRTPRSLKYYNETSFHSQGKAVDMLFSDYGSDQVRQYIRLNPGFFPYIKGMEEGVGWVHIDVRNEDSMVLFGKGL